MLKLNKQKMIMKNFEIKFGSFYENQYPLVFNYFKKRIVEEEAEKKSEKLKDVEDLASQTFTQTYAVIKKREVLYNKWKNMLWKIMKGILIDYYRKNTKKNREIFPENNEAFDLIIEKHGMFPKHKHEIITQWDKYPESKRKMHFVRGICLSKHRPLQEILLINLAPASQILKKRIKKKFPFLIHRYKERGIYYEVFYKKEKILLNNLNELQTFNNFVYKMASRLCINDIIGIKALKILLCSPDPWKDWYLLSRTSKNKTYLGFNNKGQLCKKKTIKRPYSHFFRDYLGLIVSLRDIKKFLKFEMEEKYPEYPVDQDYVKQWYAIGVLNSEILKKQRWGRKNKPGLKKKIEDYDKIFKNIIKKI